MSRSTFLDNTEAVRNSTGALVLDHSTFGHNAAAIACLESSCTLTGNHLSNNDTGIKYDTDSSGPIRGNTFTGNGSAVSTFLSSASIELNTFSGNDVAVLSNWSGDVVIQNFFTKNQTGVRLGESGITEGLQVLNNMFVDNVDGAYVVEAPPTTTPVEVDHVTFAGNTLLHGRGWAIYAPTSTDRGGNRAFGGAKSRSASGSSAETRGDRRS